MIKNYLHKIGVKLVMIGYVKDDPIKLIIHQLQCENQSLKKEIRKLSISNTVLKCKIWMVGL